jgi:pentatricopeptide repeat protein
LIQTYTEENLLQDALKILRYMDDNHIKPDVYTYSGILKCCSAIAAVVIGRDIHARIKKEGINNLILITSLLLMYGKSGYLKEVDQILDELKTMAIELDVPCWNAILMAYGQNGKAERVLELFAEMQKTGTPPNSKTCSAVLHSCGHCGKTDEAMKFLNTMEHTFGVVPDTIHYNCVIDALGRAGKLEEAEVLSSKAQQ